MNAPLRQIALLASTLLLASSHIAGAQARGEIRGRLIDAASGGSIESGSITILKSSDSSTVKSAVSAADGSFRIDGLAVGRYTVRLRSLGFTPVLHPNVVISKEHPIADLGTIALTATAAQIEGQVVKAEREDVTLSPDRNSYSTKNMTTASGGTAVDVLRNVPSVEVDASNQVSLRGNQSVVIQINGRSSTLKGEQLGNFLAQLPASAVKNVEVSTNPSAKNDPEGTAGIINIVLNQDANIGWSGGVTAATGTMGQANVSANVGHQAGPLTLFVSYSLYSSHQSMDGKSRLTNLGSGVPATVTARIDGSQQPLWHNSTFRTEYRFTPHDALSLDGTLSGGTYARDNVSYSTDLDDAGMVIGLFNQSNDLDSHYFMQDYDLAYRRTGEANQRTFSTDVRVTAADGSNRTHLFGSVEQGNASTGVASIPPEFDLSTGAWPTWTLQTDYTEPFGGHTGTKLETGLKEIERHTNNDFAESYLDSASGVFVLAPIRANSFDYREQIGAAYAVLTQQIAKLQAQAGLRLEQAANQLALPSPTDPTNRQRFDVHYASAFPSATLSYAVTPAEQAKVSYSRRINRPNPFQLDPVEYRQDARNIFRGNANLRPEYTDALELGFQQTGGWGTFQLNPYLRHTAHAVRFIQTLDSTGTTISTYDNVASTREVGTDVNVTYHPGNLTLLTGGNASHYSSNASNLAGNPSVRAFVWSARVNATWKFSPTLDAQLMTNYRSAFVTEGGSRQAFVYMNAALRRKLWNDQGSVTLRVQDPFNLLKVGSVTANAQAIQSMVQTYGIRGVVIAFSRNFGQDLKLSPPESPAAGPPTPPSPR